MSTPIISALVVIGVIVLIQVYLGLKAQKRPKVTGEKVMIGETGIIRKAKGFRRRAVLEIRGELWWCIPTEPDLELEKGMTVKITGFEDDSMILKVQKIN